MRCGVPAFRRKWPNGEDDGKKDLSLARVRYEQHAKHLRPVPVTHMHERELLTYPLWVWQRVVSHVIFSLTMRDRRDARDDGQRTEALHLSARPPQSAPRSTVP